MIRIIDSLMGTGKTTYAINMMNAAPEQRYLFLTPYQDEVERIITSCPALHFKQPTDEITKAASFHKLLAEGENIAMSHELFSRLELTRQLYGNIQKYGYTLILDEVLEVIQPVPNISRNEADMLFRQGWIDADECGAVRWRKRDVKTTRFRDIRTRADSHTLTWYDGSLFLWVFPPDMFRAFPQAYVLTFMFDGSHMKHLLDLHGIKYACYHVQDGLLMEGLPDLTAAKEYIAARIDVYEGSLNDIGNKETAFSKQWINQCKDKVKVAFLNARNLAMNRFRVLCGQVMWTCFKPFDKRPGVRGYSGGFCPCNARATNVYRERDCLLYLANVFEHPYIVRWFADQGIHVDQDAFALAQLLQWIWRSAIRDGKPIRLYIPSRRMRRLLFVWLGKPVA